MDLVGGQMSREAAASVYEAGSTGPEDIDVIESEPSLDAPSEGIDPVHIDLRTIVAHHTRGHRLARLGDHHLGDRKGRVLFAHATGPGLVPAALLGESRSWRTNVTREVRHKTLQVAQQRLRTALNRLTPKSDQAMDPEVASALEEIGL